MLTLAPWNAQQYKIDQTYFFCQEAQRTKERTATAVVNVGLEICQLQRDHPIVVVGNPY